MRAREGKKQRESEEDKGRAKESFSFPWVKHCCPVQQGVFTSGKPLQRGFTVQMYTIDYVCVYVYMIVKIIHFGTYKCHKFLKNGWKTLLLSN